MDWTSICRSPQDLTFLNEMAEQLDRSIVDLGEREWTLQSSIGADRVDEIRELWEQRLHPVDEVELRRGLDARERELLAVWERKRRAHATRALVGQTYMREYSG